MQHKITHYLLLLLTSLKIHSHAAKITLALKQRMHLIIVPTLLQIKH
jgi:hypothetical protein